MSKRMPNDTLGQIDYLLNGLTTPKQIDKAVRTFCASLSDETPQYIDYHPEPWSRQNGCSYNCEEWIDSIGGGEGKILAGYIIWYRPKRYIEAEAHRPSRRAAFPSCRGCGASSGRQHISLLLTSTPVSENKAH